MDAALRTELSEKLAKLSEKSLVTGDIWFLVEARWHSQLKTFLGMDCNNEARQSAMVGDTDDHKAVGNSDAEDALASAHPGPVDNGPLFNTDISGEIREHLVEGLDYVLVPDDAWKLLETHFGLTRGQKPIGRKVVEHGMFVKHCKVEVYLTPLELTCTDDESIIKKAGFSRTAKFESIAKQMKKLFSIPDSIECRLWYRLDAEKQDQPIDLEKSVYETGFFTGSIIIIEPKSADGTWPKEKTRQRSSDTTAPSAVTRGSDEKARESTPGSSLPQAPPPPIITKLSDLIGPSAVGAGPEEKARECIAGPGLCRAPAPPTMTRYNFSSFGDVGQSERAQPGICGLSNLGNTCFMNSIIQGLSNCPPITDYFANDNYIEDINEDNPLGMKGEIARSFGELIKSIWSGRYSYFVPRSFKSAVGRFAPQFCGYQQHDSQELLTFLLDGLHEDLNRIKKKPYIEIEDSGNRPDEEVASEAWEIYKKRNDSVILDLFHGLLKSTVVCPQCPKVSVTFDPFCYLSLPLPVRKERRIELFLVYKDPSKCPTQFRVTVPKNGTIRDLCNALAQLGSVDPDKMIVTDVYNHRFHKIYGADEGLSQIMERDDIFVYEVPANNEDDGNFVILPVYLREKKSSTSFSPSSLFGQPLLIAVPRDGTTYESLYHLILHHMSRYVTPPKSDNLAWWKSEHVVQNGVVDGDDSSSEAAMPKSLANGSTSTSNSGNNISHSDEALNEDETKNEVENDNFEYDDDDDVPMNDDEVRRGPPKLFQMNIVNSYGNSQVEKLQNDGQPLKLSGKSYLAVDWSPKAIELFFNDKEAERFAQDDSVNPKSSQKKQFRLEECLELYTTREKLGENDAWYCPTCKKHQQATKKFDIWSLPALLVISLKRFSYTRYWRDKLDTLVEFPVTGLDMAPYIINPRHGPAVYDLVAVSNHYGGMGGGHYTAYAKNKDDGRWYHFDDTSVTSALEDSVVSKAAYVLFYQRRDLAEQISKPIRSSFAVNNNNNGDTMASHHAPIVNNASIGELNGMCNGQEEPRVSSDEAMETN